MPKKLLIADDSVTIQKVMGITFASEDYDLTVVDNGADAVLKAKKIKPDLILADIVMPEKDGYEVCREIKNDPDLSSTPVILLAGTFEQYDENKSAEVGADDYITKPFESRVLIDKVNSHLEKKPASVADTEPQSDEEVSTTDELSVDIPVDDEDEFDEEIMELDLEDIVETAADSPEIAAVETEAFVAEPVSEIEAQEEGIFSGQENVESAESHGMSVEDDLADLDSNEADYQVEEDVVDKETEQESPGEKLGLGSEIDDEMDILSVSDEVVEVEGMETEKVAEEETLQVGIEEELPLTEIVEEELIVEEEISYPDLPEVEEEGLKIDEASIANLSDDKLAAIVTKVAKDVIEKIAWEVVPELAETLILEEIKRLKEGKSD